MILSVSRRTDIPSYYAEWFFNRIKEGFADVRNPMNMHQVSRVPLSPDVVDCIVFWTKNPVPMIKRLDELRGYTYYFQFSLTGYGKDVEPNLPDKKEVLVPAFQELARRIGAEKTVWRYDPILITDRYTAEYHLRAFAQLADSLKGCTRKVVISFVDLYAKTKKNTRDLRIRDLTEREMLDMAKEIALIAKKNGMRAESCAEKIDLSPAGIAHGCCIDKAMIEKLVGGKLTLSKDRGQRAECGCCESVDIGCYDTCLNGCKYCYANSDMERVRENAAGCDPMSTVLCGRIAEQDRITERKAVSAADRQLSFKLPQ